MKKINMLIGIMVLTVTFIAVTCTACGGKQRTAADPSYTYNKGADDFFEKTRLIMLKNEIQIYKHLPDEEARETFIKEFWEKRNPNPATVVNEAKMEFDRRIAFINRWFSEKMGKGRGWESDRGKVYLFLGAPDERSTSERTLRDRFGNQVAVKIEVWVYRHRRLFLEFRDARGFGEFRLLQWPADLLTAIEAEKFAVYSDQTGTQRFKFRAKYKDGAIRVFIPAKQVAFEEKGGNMNAAFEFTVYIYQNHKKIDEIKENREVTGAKEDFLKRDKIEFAFPYTPPAKGKYYFDIIVKDVFSNARYRNLIQYKF